MCQISLTILITLVFYSAKMCVLSHAKSYILMVLFLPRL